jgi:hypothetical protein
VVAVPGNIGIVVTVESDNSQQHLDHENPERKDSDAVEDLPFN